MAFFASSRRETICLRKIRWEREGERYDDDEDDGILIEIKNSLPVIKTLWSAIGRPTERESVSSRKYFGTYPLARRLWIRQGFQSDRSRYPEARFTYWGTVQMRWLTWSRFNYLCTGRTASNGFSMNWKVHCNKSTFSYMIFEQLRIQHIVLCKPRQQRHMSVR